MATEKIQPAPASSIETREVMGVNSAKSTGEDGLNLKQLLMALMAMINALGKMQENQLTNMVKRADIQQKNATEQADKILKALSDFKTAQAKIADAQKVMGIIGKLSTGVQAVIILACFATGNVVLGALMMATLLMQVTGANKAIVDAWTKDLVKSGMNEKDAKILATGLLALSEAVACGAVGGAISGVKSGMGVAAEEGTTVAAQEGATVVAQEGATVAAQEGATVVAQEGTTSAVQGGVANTTGGSTSAVGKGVKDGLVTAGTVTAKTLPMMIASNNLLVDIVTTYDKKLSPAMKVILMILAVLAQMALAMGSMASMKGFSSSLQGLPRLATISRGVMLGAGGLNAAGNVANGVYGFGIYESNLASGSAKHAQMRAQALLDILNSYQGHQAHFDNEELKKIGAMFGNTKGYSAPQDAVAEVLIRG